MERGGEGRQTDRAGEVVRELFQRFLMEKRDEGLDDSLPPKYMQQITTMREHDRDTIYVDFQDVVQHHETLADAIEQEYYRFDPYLRKALQNVVRQQDPSSVREEINDRQFWLSFFNLGKVEAIRQLHTSKVGKLLSVSGQVTRTSEVRPELLYGAFTCLDCSTVASNVPQQFKYTKPLVCPNATCTNRGKWNLNVSDSQFVDWQRVRLQENTNDIPSGSMPRTLDVILRNDVVDKARAGDRCLFTGTLIVVPDVSQLGMPGVRVQGVKGRSDGGGDNVEGVRGLKDLGVRDLTYKLAFLACAVQQVDSSVAAINIRDEGEGEIGTQFTAEEMFEIEEMRQQRDLFNKLIDSIAPAVFGHRDIKSGILLMLFGGVHKSTHEGISLRGDINVCIVGDPSCAKSQFLKYVVSFLPRAVYTSGKASSAAGLTATVARDPEDGDFNIEAGALMLADNGICCIDEFDKMDTKDQVAIHEAMEQQTISIAKAGIHATLNARTSILAAANPIGGRYDRTKTLKANICMSPAIMSRFDLFFVVLDECDEGSDARIARHIVTVHQRKEEALRPHFTTTQLQRYIKYARCLKPELTPEAGEVLVHAYRRLRQRDAGSSGKTAYRITVRQLESIIRLAEARARIHCDPKVRPEYVVEAAKLLQKSIIFVEMDDVALDLDLASLPHSIVDKTSSVALENGEKEEEPPSGKKEVEVEEELVPDEQDGQEEEETPLKKKKKLKKGKKKKAKEVHITFEKYESISNLLVMLLRKAEEKDLSFNGLTVTQCVDLYLQQAKIETESDLQTEAKLVRCIIQRLIERDHVLIVLCENEDPKLRTLTVHPNYTT